MITTGFEIAFGFFLFFLVLIVLAYGLAGSLSTMVILWAWISKRPWWVKLIAALAFLQILGWILRILGIV